MTVLSLSICNLSVDIFLLRSTEGEYISNFVGVHVLQLHS